MMAKIEESRKVCMTIGPFGKTIEEQNNRKSLEIVVNDALGKEYEIRPFHDNKPVMDSDIFNCLVDADLVVADLKGLNPNVMYELGLRHAFNKPVISLIDNKTSAPWDIDKNFTIKYDSPVEVCKVDGLVAKIKDQEKKLSMMKESESFNSFHNLVQISANIKGSQIPDDQKVFFRDMIRSIEDIRSEVASLRNSRSSHYGSFSAPNSISGTFAEPLIWSSEPVTLGTLASGNNPITGFVRPGTALESDSLDTNRVSKKK